MSAQNGHITSKVILGYLLLILIAVCSVVYIYNIIEQFAGEDDPNNKSREKVYLVTKAKRSDKWSGFHRGKSSISTAR